VGVFPRHQAAFPFGAVNDRWAGWEGSRLQTLVCGQGGHGNCMVGSKMPRKLQFTGEAGLVAVQVKCRVKGVSCKRFMAVFPNVFVSSPHFKIGSVCTLLNLTSHGSSWKSPHSPSSPLPSCLCWGYRDACCRQAWTWLLPDPPSWLCALVLASTRCNVERLKPALERANMGKTELNYFSASLTGHILVVCF